MNTGLKAALLNALRIFLTFFSLIASIAIFTTLLSYNKFDNCFNVANDLAINNYLGAFGAYCSDFLFEAFGIFAFFMPLFLLSYFLQKTLLRNQRNFFKFKSLIFFGLLPWIMIVSHLSRVFEINHDLAAGISGNLTTYFFKNTLRNYHLQYFFNEFAFILLVIGSILFLYGFGVRKNTIIYLINKINSNKILNKEISFKNEGFKNKLSNIFNKIFFKNFKELGVSRKNKNIFLEQDFDQDNGIKLKLKINQQQDEEISKDEKNTKTTSNNNLKNLTKQAIKSGQYTLPSIELLDEISLKKADINNNELEKQATFLMQTLNEFGITGEIVNIKTGPVVTIFELKPAAGIKTARVINLADDIARSMSAVSARIATVAGQNVIGIEMPNKKRHTVYMKEQLAQKEYKDSKASLPIILGQDIIGNSVVADLAKMPHLLVAGTTGSGKSVAVNAMIVSLLYKLKPDECKFIMIDPKMLELSVYNDIPHLLTPVVTEPKKAIVALKWAVKEMENRYRNIARVGVRNIEGYNQRIKETLQKGEVISRKVQIGFDPELGEPIFEDQKLDMNLLPYIVVVIDEMADLMLVAGKEVEAAVQRLAQMARAAGIHLIMATQRPSVDVITGTIKANFPTRISFQVTSKIDSRTILGEQGAEQLLGQGDMLYMSGGGRISRVHGPFMKDSEVESVVSFLKSQEKPIYVSDVTTDDESLFEDKSSNNAQDDLYNQAVQFIKQENKISISMLQRRFQIGYNKAASIVELMENKGVVSKANHQGKREIL